MLQGKRVLALIPARGGSKGLPRKNIRPLCGKPLIAWSIEQARGCSEIDAVVVSTDDQEIADVPAAFGAEVPFLRPAALASDTASSIDVVLHAVDELAKAGRSFDIVVLVEPTSPLREVSDIKGALHLLLEKDGCESVVSVAPVEATHPRYLFRAEHGMMQPYLGTPPTNIRRQDLEPLHYIDGTIYVSFVSALRARKSFYHEKTAPWFVDRRKAIEIDEISDFVCAEALMRLRNETQSD